MQGSINFDGSLMGNITGGGGGGGSEVVITPVLTSGTKIADVTVDGEDKDLFAPTPTPPTPATEVSVTQTLSSGTKIGSIEVDGDSTDLFAPTPTPPTPATEVSVTQTLASGTKIGSIEVDGESTDLYAPNPTTITVNPDLSAGTKIGTITVNGIDTDLYAPNPTAVSANPIGSTGDNIGSITINGTTYSFYAPYQSAANTSYDNTISGLTADDIQEAIDEISGITGDGQLDIGDDLTDSVNELNQNISELETYSTSEQVIGKWIDGKPIYRKSYSGMASQSTTINLDTLANIDNIIRGYGWSQSDNNNSWGIPSGRLDGYNNRWFFNTSTGALALQFDSSYLTTNKFVFTLEYTKTTD